MNERMQKALQAHRDARDAAERAAEAERGPLSDLARRIVRHRAKVAPEYESAKFDCPFCLNNGWRWGDDINISCKACRTWM